MSWGDSPAPLRIDSANAAPRTARVPSCTDACLDAEVWLRNGQRVALTLHDPAVHDGSASRLADALHEALAQRVAASVHAALRESAAETIHTAVAAAWRDAGATVVAGPLVVNLATQDVTVDGRWLDLSPTERALLVEIAAHRGRSVSYEQLAQRALLGPLAPTAEARGHAVRIRVQGLRARLGPLGSPCVVTVPSVGYRLRMDPRTPDQEGQP